MPVRCSDSPARAAEGRLPNRRIEVSHPAQRSGSMPRKGCSLMLLFCQGNTVAGRISEAGKTLGRFNLG